ncbi:MULTISPECIES: acylphosphatase [unclassified Nocardioides]|uniref:acylphosphatase n=1 Tax=unclassified Nocardioides TaxID=2615069 RepID=UPI0009F118D3|nr:MULTISPECIES: acylphosphatase [unclassified Nocardioides]GAW51728.1 acylphosphatase [Nocardioides sp. PD653-B2]GAW55304.1 acylphosphatase [Nocardioides sp. PD653]
MRKSVDVTVTGRVQGVSFRYYTGQEAARLGVTGRVANEPDGTVSGHFEGEADAVDALVDWCRTGPRPARVERVDVRPGVDEGATSFEAR